jgi:flavorubredoxin
VPLLQEPEGVIPEKPVFEQSFGLETPVSSEEIPSPAPNHFYGKDLQFHGGIPLTMRIAYFSGSGHTGKVATALARLLDAELVKIEPLRESGMPGKLLKTLFVMRSAIKPCPTDLTGIDRLIIATPVWAAKVPPYVNEYLAGVSGCAGKPFHVIAEMAGRGSEGTIAGVRKELEKKGMRFVSSATTIERDVESGAYLATVEAFAAGIRRE